MSISGMVEVKAGDDPRVIGPAESLDRGPPSAPAGTPARTAHVVGWSRPAALIALVGHSESSTIGAL